MTSTQPPWTSATATNLQWFTTARFGLFLHWGLYAVPAGVWKGKPVPYIGEWIQHEELIPKAEYAQLADQFTAEHFDAHAWVATARSAGMRYVVLTAKHHEGFALWDSTCDAFSSVRAANCGRDIVRELADACRAGGLRLGLYYSHCVDWHEAHGGNLPDDVKDPSRISGQGRTWGNDWDFPPGTAAGFDEYLQRKVEPQLTELLTRYGDIALIWFDTPTASLQPLQAKRLRDLIKHLQPGCLIGGRIGHNFQDFDSLGDNQVPSAPLDRVGETCMTLNDTWGFKLHDHAWATPAEVINLLSACTATNANLLLNVGPMADGRLPTPAHTCLAQVGHWLATEGSAIYDCGAAGLPNQQPWGTVTRGGSVLHLLVNDGSRNHVTLPLPTNAELQSARFTAEQDIISTTSCTQSGNWLSIALPPAHEQLPRHIELHFSVEPQWDQAPSEDPLGTLTLTPKNADKANGNHWHGWASTGDSVTWNLRCTTAGRFRIEVLCGGERYGEWYGGHVIEIRSESGCVNGTMHHGIQVDGRAAQHYPLYCISFGELDLLAGTQAVTLTVTSTSGHEPAHFPELRLQRLS